MKRRPVAKTPPSTPALVEQAGRCMAQGQWREAIEGYKQLLKQDPGGGWALPLMEAYQRRAEAMADKAMHKEALILLDNADRLGNCPNCSPLRLTCLLAIGRTTQAAAFYFAQESGL